MSPKVVLPAKRSNASHSGLPAAKADIGQAVAQAHKASHTSKKKNRKSDPSVSKGSRQQAPREKKLMYSIEHSPQKKTPSPTPLHETKDGDYLPTAAELAETNLSTAQSTPSRRSPRQDASTRRNTGSLPKPRPKTSALQPSSQATCALAVTNMEPSAAGCDSPNLEVGLEPKPLSPSLWNSQLRREKYQQAGIVELPREVFEYKRSKKAKKDIDRQVAAKRKDMKEGKRKEKGKSAEQRPINESNEPNQRDQCDEKMDKKRLRDDLEKTGPCKRQKLQESRKSTEDTSESKHRRARSSSKTHGFRASVAKAEAPRNIADVPSAMGTRATNHSTEGENIMRSRRPPGLEMPEERSGQFDGPASRNHGPQGLPPNEDWRKPFERREVHLSELGRTCSCKRLPDFFKRNPYDVPCLATWQATCRGGEHEFFRNVKKISCCRGSVHPLHVIYACRKMLEERFCSKHWDTDSVVDSAQGILFKNGQDSHNVRRAQSSIPPPIFYGSAGSSRQAPGPRSFTRFMPEMTMATSSSESHTTSKPSKEISITSATRNAPAKHDGAKRSTDHAGRPVDQLTTADAVRNSKTHPVPPISCVSGKRNRAHIPNFDVYNDFTPEEELVGKEQTSNTLSEASKQPEHSFKAKRQRHQSVPANLPSRKPTVNELSLSPSPEPQRREGVLQEIYNHVIFKTVNKSLAPIEKCIKDLRDRILPPPPAQTAAVTQTPAPAGAPMPNVAPQPENNVELPRTRKRKRKPVAERKRKLPEQSRDVPAHLRLPDADLIAIGRNSSRYERHRAAPYAFTWHGHLLAEYDYLLRLEGNDWTAKEIKRVSR